DGPRQPHVDHPVQNARTVIEAPDLPVGIAGPQRAEAIDGEIEAEQARSYLVKEELHRTSVRQPSVAGAVVRRSAGSRPKRGHRTRLLVWPYAVWVQLPGRLSG